MTFKKEKKLNFLFVSKWGEILDIAHAVKQEGNNVKMYVDVLSCREVGDGFVAKARDWKKHIKWADIIIFDYTGWGKEATRLRKQGKLVFGGCEYADQLELDRNFGQSELKRMIL